MPVSRGVHSTARPMHPALGYRIHSGCPDSSCSRLLWYPQYAIRFILLWSGFMPSFSLIACGLQCYCAEYVNGIKIPLDPPCPTDTCETSGVCAVDLSIIDEIHTVVKYHCIENVHDQVSSIHITCMVPHDPKQIVLCCNKSDLCNKNLSTTFPLITESTVSIMNPVPTTTPTTSSSSKGKVQCTCLCLYIIYYSHLFLAPSGRDRLQ